jgi:hypothetical protein
MQGDPLLSAVQATSTNAVGFGQGGHPSFMQKGVALSGGFVIKNISRPDEVRTYAKGGRVDVLRFGDITFGKFTKQPGWRWSESVKPLAKTDYCMHEHHLYIQSGRLCFLLQNGLQYHCKAGDLVHVAPGYDVWVEGDEV